MRYTSVIHIGEEPVVMTNSVKVSALSRRGKRFAWAPFVGAGAAGLVLSLPLSAQKDIASPGFERDVAPILNANCTMCHGGTTPQAGLDLTSLPGLLKGGKSGKAIIPG